MIRVAIAGAGRMGKAIAAGIDAQPDLELVGDGDLVAQAPQRGVKPGDVEGRRPHIDAAQVGAQVHGPTVDLQGSARHARSSSGQRKVS